MKGNIKEVRIRNIKIQKALFGDRDKVGRTAKEGKKKSAK